MNAPRNFNVTTTKRNHRAYKLVCADPEWKSGIDYCTGKIIALPGTKSAERRAQYAQLRAVWTQIVYSRHGYDATSYKWNAALKAFNKASREFFCFRAHTPSGVLLKVETLLDLEELAREGDTSQSADDTLYQSRKWFAEGIAADLSRIKPNSVQQFRGSKMVALDHLAGAA